MKTSRFDSRGMSLIEVTIALGIASVMSMVMVSLLQNQARETQAMSDKMAALDFQRTVEGAISVATSCTKNVVGNLAPGESLTFDPAGITTTDKNKPKVIAKLQKVYGTDGLTVLADSTASDRTVSPLSNNLKLQSGSGLQLAAYKDAASGQLVYQLQLAFDGTTLVRPIHNLAMTINATTVAAGSNLQVTGCIGASAGAPSGSTGAWCGAFQGVEGYPDYWISKVYSKCKDQVPSCTSHTFDGGCANYSTTAICPSGYTLTMVMSAVGSVDFGEGGEVNRPTSTGSTLLLTCMQ